MPFEQITATTPVVKPAEPEVVYDKYWLSSLRIQAGNPTEPVRLVAVFTPSKDVTVQVQQTDAEGNPVTVDVTYKELMPNAESKRLIIQDLFKEAESDPAGLGAIMNAVIVALRDKALAQGLI